IAVETLKQANQSGAMGDLSALRAIFQKAISEARETE
ncbi:putative adenosine monophosphate-protein transferase Fic, partial [Salmonella enterica subsp. enterica serovar Typhimurium]|nr:putative adenosine monophosphate-protein transferase Fic [Salmonella enterica subsp. enterica serovar Typhimurium]